MPGEGIAGCLALQLERRTIMREQDIIFEVGSFWALRVKSGHYEIYKAGICASVRAGSVQFSNDDSRARALAIQQCTARNDKDRQT